MLHWLGLYLVHLSLLVSIDMHSLSIGFYPRFSQCCLPFSFSFFSPYAWGALFLFFFSRQGFEHVRGLLSSPWLGRFDSLLVSYALSEVWGGSHGAFIWLINDPRCHFVTLLEIQAFFTEMLWIAFFFLEVISSYVSFLLFALKGLQPSCSE